MDSVSSCVNVVPPSSLSPIPSATAAPPFVPLPPVEDERTPPLTLPMRAGLMQIRDARPLEVEAYVNYWHYSDDKVKDLMGIDRRRLGTPEDSRNRFLTMVRHPGTNQADAIFTITLNDKIIGYTNINCRGIDDNYCHVHAYPCCPRSALLGLTLLVGPAMAMYFTLFPVRRLVLETRPQNRWINHALDLYGLPVETKYVDNPGGLGAAGEKRIRYVHRDDLRGMLSRSESARKEYSITNPELRAKSLQAKNIERSHALAS